MTTRRRPNAAPASAEVRGAVEVLDTGALDTALTCTSFRTEYKIGTHGHRYVVRVRGHVVADTDWHTTPTAAMAAFTEAVGAITTTSAARFLQS